MQQYNISKYNLQQYDHIIPIRILVLTLWTPVKCSAVTKIKIQQ